MPQELAVLSPEKTVLTFPIAGLGSRILAHFLDVTAAALIIYILDTIIGLTLPLIGLSAVAEVLILQSFFIFFLYFIILEGFWNGQTFGKKALGVRVRMADGTPVRFGAVLGRNLLRPADFVPAFYFVGILAMFTNPKSQRIGDLISGTIVVLEKRAEPRFAPTPYSLGVHPFESYVGELRGMTSEDYVALRQLCDRFPQLPAAVQNRLIEEVWNPAAEKLHIKPLQNVHSVYLAEAVVMKYGRRHGLL